MIANYFLRRLLYTVPIILGVTLITFILFNLVGGDPALMHAGKNASPEMIAQIRTELGMDRSLPKQYLFFLKQVVTFDWGHSWSTQESISQMFRDGIGPSLSITLPAFVLSCLLALALALFSVTMRHSVWSQLIIISCLVLMSISFLVYIIFFQKFLAFDLNMFPVYGWDTGIIKRWQYVTLPCLIYLCVSIGPKILLFRTALLEDIESDYVRTARAKGISSWNLYTHHILNNALIPILTLIISQMPTLITGSLILEAFFGIPGLGGLLVRSIQNSDFPVIKAMTVVGTLFYIFLNLMNDLIYSWIDPRIELR